MTLSTKASVIMTSAQMPFGWLQKNGITTVLLFGEEAETVLFSTDQFIYTYICTGCTVLLDPILQRKNGTHKTLLHSLLLV